MTKEDFFYAIAISVVIVPSIGWCWGKFIDFILTGEERKFWKHHSKRNVKVVLTTREGEDISSTLKVSLNEVQAFAALKMTLHKLRQDLSLVSELKPTIGELNDNPFISIGGPIKNALTNSILQGLKGEKIVRFDRETKNLHVGGEEYAPELNTDKTRKTDFGVIIRLSKKNRRSYDCILAMGCHGFGTEAAAKTITDKENLKALNKRHKSGDFIQVVEVEINQGKIGKIDLRQGFSLTRAQ